VLGFVVLRRAVGILVALEALSQFADFGGHAHFVELTIERRKMATTSPSRTPRHRVSSRIVARPVAAVAAEVTRRKCFSRQNPPPDVGGYHPGIHPGPRYQALMPPQNQPVIHTLGLVVFQWRDVSKCGLLFLSQ